jgi:flagellar biosynthetic protein FlhB
MADESDAEKTEEPSQHRIDQFRDRGEVASSKELTSVLVLSASLLTLALSMVFIYETLTEYMDWLYGLDVAYAYTEKSMKTIVTKTITAGLTCLIPIFLTVICVGVFANVAQIGFLFSPEVLQWKPERINPISGVKRLFSMKSVVEALKGLFKFIFILAIVYAFMKDDLTSWSGFLHMDFFSSFMFGKTFLVKLGFAMITGLLVIAIGDFAYQKISYKNKLRQTREDAKRESKEQDGNPEVKQKIRAIQREMSQKRMMAEIPTADVIITNPTHISIIVKYDQDTMVSPQVMGKGADNLAMRIREIAKENNVPIVENVPLARTLYKTVKEGEGVPRSLYKAVAEILAFVYKLKRKQKALS